MPIFYGKPYRGPCVIEVRSSGYSPSKYYGPFPSLRESKTWMNIQYSQGFTGTFSICPIFTPYRVRDYDDWWMSESNRSPQAIADDLPSKSWFKLSKWRRWLRSTSKLHYKAYMNKPIDFDDLPQDTRLKYIESAFEQLYKDDQVPYDVLTGDSCTWDEYDPAIDLAKRNYEDDMSFNES